MNYHHIVVHVHDNTYDLHGPNDARSDFLMTLVQKVGGINVSVPDGFYMFNAIPDGYGGYDLILKPFDDSKD